MPYNAAMSVDVEDIRGYFSSNDSIRSMNYTDLKRVMVVEEQAYTHPWTIGIFRDCIRTGYHCWVFEQNREIIAYGVIMIAAGESHILNITVEPAYQGQGIGRKILKHLVEDARKADVEVVLLEVRASNRKAIMLYLSEGFNELGVRSNYYPDENGREDAIILARYLKNPWQSHADQ